MDLNQSFLHGVGLLPGQQFPYRLESLAANFEVDTAGTVSIVVRIFDGEGNLVGSFTTATLAMSIGLAANFTLARGAVAHAVAESQTAMGPLPDLWIKPEMSVVFVAWLTIGNLVNFKFAVATISSKWSE